jgi:hypothetical protein
LRAKERLAVVSYQDGDAWKWSLPGDANAVTVERPVSLPPTLRRGKRGRVEYAIGIAV